MATATEPLTVVDHDMHAALLCLRDAADRVTRAARREASGSARCYAALDVIANYETAGYEPEQIIATLKQIARDAL